MAFSEASSCEDFANARTPGLPLERAFQICNHAGVLVAGKAIEDVTALDWEWIVGVNLFGTINGRGVFLPRIHSHKAGGHVVNIAASRRRSTQPIAGPPSAERYAALLSGGRMRSALGRPRT